ncbi:MAG: phosphotransferase [Nocardioides sp.]|uniref:phosphotransferase n=1 Tax=Nocardioides sp. TaxID=35761 RepID=UPI003F0562D6
MDEFADWALVTSGRSGAVLRRSPGGMAYAKSGPDVAHERDRLLWLAGTDVVAPRVLDWVEGPVPTLVTAALPGVPAASVPMALRPVAAESVREAVGRLHALDVAACPFDRRLRVTVAEARRRADTGLVDLDDLDPERAGATVASLLDDLAVRLPHAEEAETSGLAVCHGDATADNVLVSPDTGRLVGVVDVGSLGVADRHLDLALVSRTGPVSVALAGRPWTADADPVLLEFYRLLDEFF